MNSVFLSFYAPSFHPWILHIADKTIIILRSDNSKYVWQDFHVGGKRSPLVCYKDEIAIPAQLQIHVIMWYSTLCHPGINRTKETIRQHYGGQKWEITYLTILRFALYVNVQRSMDYSHQRKLQQHPGINYASIYQVHTRSTEKGKKI